MKKGSSKNIIPAKYDLQTVSVPMVRSLFIALERAGCDPSITFDYAGIVPDIMSEDRARVDAEQYSKLFYSTICQLEDEAFGTLNRPLTPGTFALNVQWMANAINLRDAIERAAQLFAIMDIGLVCELVEKDKQATVRISIPAIEDPVSLFFLETMLTTLHRLSGWLIGEYIPLLHVCLGREAPDHRDEYPRMFRAPINFSSIESSFTFQSDLLDNYIARQPKDVRELVKSAPLGLLQHTPFDGSYYHRVKNILRQSRPHFPGLPSIAVQLGITEQTLRRRLHDEGQSFRGIKTEFLRDYSLRLLVQKGLTLDEISIRLGFSELSAFTRAFRLWIGQAPSRYRDKYLF